MSAFAHPVHQTDPVGFALSYPFARPAGSFVFRASDGAVLSAGNVAASRASSAVLDGLQLPVVSVAAEIDGERVAFPDRIPVLASGSNAAPSQLARKYRAFPATPPILVHEVEVAGIASVYSAHVARYGSVAATLAPCAASVARLHVLFLPPEALPHLNRTESLGINYLLARLDRTPLELPGAGVPPLAYISRRGPVRFDGNPHALAGTGSGGFATADQREIQHRLRALMGERGELRAFVARLIADEPFRKLATARLAETTRRVLPRGATVLAGA